MTHIAWVPEAWDGPGARGARRDGASGIRRARSCSSPSRDAGVDRIDADVSLERYAMPGVERDVCSEVDRAAAARHARQGAREHRRAAADLRPARLPALARRAGRGGRRSSTSSCGIADRMIVDSTEWDDLPYPYTRLAELFDRTAVSDIAWARTSRWRSILASLWPEIASVVDDPRARDRRAGAPARRLAALAARPSRDRARARRRRSASRASTSTASRSAFPPGDPPLPSDVLSDELDRFTRDPVYEAAVLAATK